jgi:hypothetical protein
MSDLLLSSITKMEQEWHVLCATYLIAAAVFGDTMLLSTGKKKIQMITKIAEKDWSDNMRYDQG